MVSLLAFRKLKLSSDLEQAQIPLKRFLGLYLPNHSFHFYGNFPSFFNAYHNALNADSDIFGIRIWAYGCPENMYSAG